MKIIVRICLLGWIFCLAGCANSRPESALTPSPSTTPTPFACVVLDAGHGGIDQGCVGETGTLEAELNLDIVLRMQKILEDAGVACVLTRADESVHYDSTDPRTRKNQDMIDRAQTIAQAEPDAVVSIHMNRYSDPSVNGPQVLCRRGDDVSLALAQTVQNALSAIPEVQKKRSVLLSDDLYILNASPCPAILAECGFLSHQEEEARLATQAYRQTLAQAVADALIVWLTEYQQQGENSHAVSGN